MLLKAWRGEERFWKVWWLLGVPLQALWWTVWFDLWKSGLAPEHFVLIAVWFWPGALAVLTAFGALFLTWCMAAWRCAGNVDNLFSSMIARVLIGVTLGSFVTECLLIFAVPFG
jgi:hypothetical protein